MTGGAPVAREPIRFLRRAIEVWALLGGLVLTGIAVMSTWSAASGWLFGRPLPGDFEMVEMLVAVSVFMFLPYCQVTGASVAADLFAARAGPRPVARVVLLAGVVALGGSRVLRWRM
jgi:hypothetical protein